MRREVEDEVRDEVEDEVEVDSGGFVFVHELHGLHGFSDSLDGGRACVSSHRREEDPTSIVDLGLDLISFLELELELKSRQAGAPSVVMTDLPRSSAVRL